MIKNWALTLAITVSLFQVSFVWAGPATDSLSKCMADNTTGKDRKELATWVFAAMSAHPEIQGFTNFTVQKRDELDRMMADMVTKLLTEKCAVQSKSAMQQEGGEAFKAAFGFIGKLAMQELMTNSDVSASFTSYSKYLDQSKFKAAFSGK